jgi:hypothetical protein
VIPLIVRELVVGVGDLQKQRAGRELEISLFGRPLDSSKNLRIASSTVIPA